MHLAAGDRQIVEHVDAVLAGVADPVDGVDGLEAVELVAKHALQLLRRAGEHGPVADVEQALLEFRRRRDLRRGKGALDGGRFGPLDAEVVPGLVGHLVAHVIQRVEVAVGDAHHGGALAQGLVPALLVVEQLVVVVLGAVKLAGGALVLLHVQVEPVQARAVGEVEFLALVPLVHQQALFLGRLGQQQGALVAGLGHVQLDALGALLGAVDEGPALVQVVPVDLLGAALRDDSRLALEAQRAGLLRPTAHVGLGDRLVIQRPHQARQALVRLLAGLLEGLERLLGQRRAAHHRDGRGVVVQQGDRVEDALDDVQLLDLAQVERRRAPPDALVAFARLEAGLLLAEALRTVDQPFPVAALFQREAHRRAAGVDVAAPVVLLAVPAGDQLQAKAAGELQVGAGCGHRVLGGGRGSLAPVVEQVVIQLFDVDAVTTFFRTAADQHPGRVVEGVEGLLAAVVRRAFALAHVVGAGHVLEAEVALDAAQHLGP